MRRAADPSMATRVTLAPGVHRPRRPQPCVDPTRLPTHPKQARYSTDYASICGKNIMRGTFTGHERDPESTLDYMLARYCSSALARFLATDSSAQSISPASPQSWNRFSYTLNNPLRFVDPRGQVTYGSMTGHEWSLEDSGVDGPYGALQ